MPIWFVISISHISQSKEASLNPINSKALIRSSLGTFKVQGPDVWPCWHLAPLLCHFIQTPLLEQMPVRISQKFCILRVIEPREPHSLSFCPGIIELGKGNKWRVYRRENDGNIDLLGIIQIPVWNKQNCLHFCYK